MIITNLPYKENYWKGDTYFSYIVYLCESVEMVKTLQTSYISLTVHLGIILVNNQLDALFSVYLFIYFPSLHVSSNPVLIIRRIELYQYDIWYIRGLEF